jgi:N-acetylglucosaminyl-diphospho-decaprenol L-rhamnosyltransferase
MERCLAAIARDHVSSAEEPWPVVDGLRTEVIVVDNASSDGTVEMVSERFPWVTLIANRDNVGFAGGTNQGLAIGRGQYHMLLNPDCELQPGALRTLVDFLAANPKVGAAGPRLLNSDRSLQLSVYREPTLLRELWRLLHLDALWPYGNYRPQAWALDRAHRVAVVQGACLMMPRAALEQVGMLDEDYFMYSEEVDLCARLRKQGWQVYWVPQGLVVHHGAQSTRQVAAAMFLRLYQSKVLYFRKQRGRLSARVYKVILACVSVMRLALLPVACVVRPGAIPRQLTLARYYARLLRALPGL